MRLSNEQQEIKTRLEKEFNISSDHPKANKLFNLAWEYGHAFGGTEIRSYYKDLLELIEEE